MPEDQKIYNENFLSYASRVSKQSSEIIVPLIKKLIPNVESVVDFGCAQGVWLKTWLESGVRDIQGFDGDYVDRALLYIPEEKFTATNLNEPVSGSRKFDLAYSFEVGEHLKPERAEQFIESITSFSDFAIFAASPPGQGGENHINERPFDDWRQMFLSRGYIAFDCIRPLIKDLDTVSFWYRYNTILYVKENRIPELSPEVLDTRIADSGKIQDISPPLFRVRKLIIRLLPYSIQNILAQIKASFHNA